MLKRMEVPRDREMKDSLLAPGNNAFTAELAGLVQDLYRSL